ncbi:uncharacterized protein LOC121405721 [Lytechinus variegatus]|uniref:uncharacterized protein LOC121405721 n=1 Tax=Lytechinus variegatus TaxID=7654 RepID=UPI001BB1B930|nr:uncharacterized protein LOC121405721 [Lytechinus variegatus]
MTSPDQNELGAMETYLEAIQHNKVSDELDVEFPPPFGYVRDIESAETLRRRFEQKFGVRFSTYRQSKDYGKEDIKIDHHKVCWEDGSRLRQGHLVFDHIPYIVIGIKTLDCQYGRDRHVARKKRSLAQEDDQKRRKRLSGKKVDCPAQISFRDILKFPDYKIESNTVWRRKAMSEKLRKSLSTGSDVKIERRIYVKFPEASDHKCAVAEDYVPDRSVLGHQVLQSSSCVSGGGSDGSGIQSEVQTQVLTMELAVEDVMHQMSSETTGVHYREPDRTSIHIQQSPPSTEASNTSTTAAECSQEVIVSDPSNTAVDGTNAASHQRKKMETLQQLTHSTDPMIQVDQCRRQLDDSLLLMHPSVINQQESQVDSLQLAEDINTTNLAIQSRSKEIEPFHLSEDGADQGSDCRRQMVHVDVLRLSDSSNDANQCGRQLDAVQSSRQSDGSNQASQMGSCQSTKDSDGSNRASQCRRLLEELTEETYTIQDISILDALQEQLRNTLRDLQKAKQERVLIPSGQTSTDILDSHTQLGKSSNRYNSNKPSGKIHPNTTGKSCTCKNRSCRICSADERVEFGEVMREELCSNQSVSSRIIREAQALILEMFPLMHGFEETTLGNHLLFSAAQGEFGQLMNDGKDHWIFVTSISCAPGTVKYYDSMGARTIPDIIRKQIACIVCSQDTQISVEIQPVQLSKDFTDCGLFAIAFAVSVLYSEDPALVCYDITSMRDHLYHCFQKRSLIPFPKIDKSMERTVKRTISVDVFCLCRMPWYAIAKESKMKMAHCSMCGEWWHSNCCGIPDPGQRSSWKCPRCEDVQSAVSALNSLQSVVYPNESPGHS